MYDLNKTLRSVEKTFQRWAEEERANTISFEDIDPYEAASQALGYPGAMLSGSKQAAPERRVVWNANVLANKMKIWHGDLSITEKSEQLQGLANLLNVKIHVLREMDCRFDTAGKPRIENAVETFEPQS